MEKIEQIIRQIKTEADFFNKARLINYLRKEKDVPLKDLAIKLGLKPSYICHILRLNRLPEIIVDGYYAKLVSLSHLFTLSRIKDQRILIQIYEKILTNNLNIQQTEELVRENLYNIKTRGMHLSKEERSDFIKKIIGNQKNIEVKIIQTRIKGTLIIKIKGELEITSQKLKQLLKRFENWAE